MAYWGANVKAKDKVIMAKIHGPNIFPEPNELIEYIANLAKEGNVSEGDLANFMATKIAKAYRNHPEALYVTVDVLTTDGALYGATEMIEEQL